MNKKSINKFFTAALFASTATLNGYEVGCVREDYEIEK